MSCNSRLAAQDQVGFLNLDSLTVSINSLDAEHGRVEEVERLVECLAHSSQCMDCSCPWPSCYRMKVVLVHTKECSVEDGCQVCAQLVALCCYHARVCRDMGCGIEYCHNIKRKLGELEAGLQH